MGNKVEVWAYCAKTLELIKESPFSSIQAAANYFNVNYRTISRHLDTKLATIQNNILVYLFRKEINSVLKNELLTNLKRARNARSEIWVYKVEDNGGLTLIPNKKLFYYKYANIINNNRFSQCDHFKTRIFNI